MDKIQTVIISEKTLKNLIQKEKSRTIIENSESYEHSQSLKSSPELKNSNNLNLEKTMKSIEDKIEELKHEIKKECLIMKFQF